MAKKDSDYVRIFKIFANGVKLYFFNFEKFFKYMAFPVIGQIVGIVLIFLASYIFTVHVTDITVKSPVFDNVPLVFAMLLVLTLPGFFIFCKAFWDYLIAMVALNSMASNLLEGAKLDDTALHSELIKRRTGSYILFMLILSLIYMALSFPILWGLLAIVFVFLALAFQVFALEEDKSAFDAIKTSVSLVKGNFAKTLLLLILLGIFTYWLVPRLICWGVETGNLCGIFSYPVEKYVQLLPLQDLNDLFAQANLPISLKSYDIAKNIVLSGVSFVVTAFALPLRCLCCTELYKDFVKRNYAGKIAAEKLAERAKSTKNKKKTTDDNGD